MPTNKHATIRYHALDKCFRNPGKKYFMPDLIEACSEAIYEYTGVNEGIERRQVYYDIQFMKSEQGWSIPLETYRENRKAYYRYTDLNFSIRNQPLNESEANQLKEALMTLNRFKGMPQFEWVEEMTARLDASFNLSNVSRQVIDFEQNQYLKGLDFISTLYHAIIYRKVLAITYQSFKKQKPSTGVYHPYFLKQYNNRWFLFCKHDKYDNMTNLALDRIIEIKEEAISYVENTKTDFIEYFEDAIGVTIIGQPQKVRMKVANSLFPYIKSKPLHGSQKIKKENENDAIVELSVIINYELKSLLFSYGEELTIIEPPSLAEELKNKALKIIDNYK